jgi:hypothetical protein
MKKTRSKLTKFIIATSLCAAATITTISQDRPPIVIDRDALAARGAVLAGQDPLASELRNQFEDAGRNGFHIGMAVAEGQTLPGPGKDRICASLFPGEPGACSIAVLFSVERNRNAVLASRGAAMVNADPIFAEARNAAPDVRLRRASDIIFYRLGFDIGLAASEGHTLPGPGKDRIRDSLLVPAEQGGFSRAVSFSIERNRLNSGLGAATSETTAGPAERAASREIRCRGYSRAGGSEYVFFIIDSRPGQAGETLVTYEMAFTPGTRAAGVRGEGLQPGNCAWADRPIDEKGPYRIRFETVANAQLKQQLHGSQVDRSSTAAESYPDVKSLPIYLKGENHYWSFGGITNTGSYFVATGHGYWKPAIAIGDVPRSPTEPARRKSVLYPTKP